MSVEDIERLFDEALENGDACFGCARDARGNRIHMHEGKVAHGPDCPYAKKHGWPPGSAPVGQHDSAPTCSVVRTALEGDEWIACRDPAVAQSADGHAHFCSFHAEEHRREGFATLPLPGNRLRPIAAPFPDMSAEPLLAEAIEETKTHLARELAEVEAAIAKEHGLTGDVRAELVRRMRSGDIHETALVQRWCAVYSAFVAWDRMDPVPEETS